jgi:hypothetical protein
MVIQPQPSAAELFSKDSIFFAQVIDGILLLLVHPAGHGDEHKADWVKALLRFPVQSLLCIWGAVVKRPVLSIRSDFWTLRDPDARDAVKLEGTTVLPGLFSQGQGNGNAQAQNQDQQ